MHTHTMALVWRSEVSSVRACSLLPVCGSQEYNLGKKLGSKPSFCHLGGTNFPPQVFNLISEVFWVDSWIGTTIVSLNWNAKYKAKGFNPITLLTLLQRERPTPLSPGTCCVPTLAGPWYFSTLRGSINHHSSSSVSTWTTAGEGAQGHIPKSQNPTRTI